MLELLETIRKASLPGLWSEGVKLARQELVTRVSATSSEMTMRVRARGHVIAPTVTLFVEEHEWSCDCGGKVDPCAHVAAAAIFASNRTAERTEADGGIRPPTGAQPPKIRYRLLKKERVLTLTRFIVYDGEREERLTGSLASDLARGRLPAGLTPTHDDLSVERLLGVPPREVVPVSAVAALFAALSNNDEVRFQGTAVKVSGEAIFPRAVVEDADKGGFSLRIERHPDISEVIAMGVARCGDVLRPLGETATTGHLLERLPLSRTFVGPEEADLVTKVLPELENRVVVTLATKRLPRASADARPRIELDLSHRGHTLSVLPNLVYGDPPIARVDGDSVVPFGDQVPVRRRDEEREILAKLRDELNLVPGRRVDLDGQDATRFATKLRAFQKGRGDDGRAALVQKRNLIPRLDLEDGRFDVIFECEPEPGQVGDPPRAEAAAVLQAFRDGLELVPLVGGGWAPLPSNWLELHAHRVVDLFSARDAEKNLATAALPELAALCDELNEPKPFAIAKLAPLLEGFVGIPRASLPSGVNANLRAYQVHGVDWLAFLRGAGLGAVLADDMGLGKTLQTICVLEGRALVVCPKSVVYNWAEEIARFRPGLRTVIYHGPARELDDAAAVTLTTYAVLRLDAARLAREPWDIVVLDEAQAIKNAGSQTAKAAFEIPGAFRVALSGTPVENRLEELWSVMNFANPGLLGRKSDFQERYANPIGNGNAEAARRLRAKIKPFVLRRMKRDVVPELPPRTDSVLHVELDDAERAVYDAVRVATKKEVAEKLAQGGGVLAALEALLRLRQAACHPRLVPGQHAETSSKVERLVDALEEVAADGHKALVFSQWTSLLDLIEPHLERAGIRFTRLDGSTRDRQGVIVTFQGLDGPPVMLVSLKAGGTGLNLTAADHVFLVDPWWNPAVEDQAADRAHRIGQERPVMVYRMVAKDTVEERILALQARKRGLSDVALGDANQAFGVTRAELLALLE